MLNFRDKCLCLSITKVCVKHVANPSHPPAFTQDMIVPWYGTAFQKANSPLLLGEASLTFQHVEWIVSSPADDEVDDGTRLDCTDWWLMMIWWTYDNPVLILLWSYDDPMMIPWWSYDDPMMTLILWSTKMFRTLKAKCRTDGLDWIGLV